MSHKNKLSLVAQVQCALEAQLAIGQSKHVDKLNGSTQVKYTVGRRSGPT